MVDLVDEVAVVDDLVDEVAADEVEVVVVDEVVAVEEELNRRKNMELLRHLLVKRLHLIKREK